MENVQTPKQWADEVIAWIKPIRTWESTKHGAQKTLMWVNGMAALANADSDQDCLGHPNGLAGDLMMTSRYHATAQWFLPWVWKLQEAKTAESFQSTWQRCSNVFARFLSHANSGKHTTALWKLESKEDEWTRLLLKWSKATGTQRKKHAALSQTVWFSWCAECVDKKDNKSLTKTVQNVKPGAL